MGISFTKHPREVGETYAEHLVFATRFGGAMLLGGLGCMVHALFPFCCTKTGSDTVRRLHGKLGEPRCKAAKD